MLSLDEWALYYDECASTHGGGGRRTNADPLRRNLLRAAAPRSLRRADLSEDGIVDLNEWLIYDSRRSDRHATSLSEVVVSAVGDSAVGDSYAPPPSDPRDDQSSTRLDESHQPLQVEPLHFSPPIPRQQNT